MTSVVIVIIIVIGVAGIAPNLRSTIPLEVGIRLPHGENCRVHCDILLHTLHCAGDAAARDGDKLLDNSAGCGGPLDMVSQVVIALRCEAHS